MTSIQIVIYWHRDFWAKKISWSFEAWNLFTEYLKDEFLTRTHSVPITKDNHLLILREITDIYSDNYTTRVLHTLCMQSEKTFNVKAGGLWYMQNLLCSKW